MWHFQAAAASAQAACLVSWLVPRRVALTVRWEQEQEQEQGRGTESGKRERKRFLTERLSFHRAALPLLPSLFCPPMTSTITIRRCCLASCLPAPPLPPPHLAPCLSVPPVRVPEDETRMKPPYLLWGVCAMPGSDVSL